MKKVLAFFVSLLFLSCLTGCLLVPKDTEPVEQIGEGTLGSYYVKITDHFVAKTISGKDVFILSFDFTNNNSSGVSAASALGLTLFQSGIELSQASVLFPISGYSSSNYHTKIKDGATLNCQVAFSAVRRRQRPHPWRTGTAQAASRSFRSWRTFLDPRTCRKQTQLCRGRSVQSTPAALWSCSPSAC